MEPLFRRETIQDSVWQVPCDTHAPAVGKIKTQCGLTNRPYATRSPGFISRRRCVFFWFHAEHSTRVVSCSRGSLDPVSLSLAAVVHAQVSRQNENRDCCQPMSVLAFHVADSYLSRTCPKTLASNHMHNESGWARHLAISLVAVRAARVCFSGDTGLASRSANTV
ncbi:hypothetical protein BKA80DRAFT_142917 [Phyllosticta citrichinensis]